MSLAAAEIAERAQDYDVTSDWHVAHPYLFLRKLRRDHPVFRSANLESFVLTRYSDVRAALSDHDRFSSLGILTASTRLTDEVREMLGAHDAFLGRFAANVDPPTHTRLRRAMSRAFTPRAVAAMKERYRELVHESVDRVVTDGHGDLVADFATYAPARLMARFTGIPEVDGARVTGWVEDWFQLFLARVDPAIQPRLAASFLEYLDYVVELISARIDEPTDDFASVMAAHVDGTPDGLDRLDVVEQISALLLGGNDTVPNGIGSTAYRLLEGGHWRALADEPELVGQAVEEGLRCDGAATGIFRLATTDVELHGVTIPAGSFVFVSQDSAGHDETVFTDPEVFDLHRPNASEHMAFGHGIHHCVGAALKLEMRVALEVLATRLPSLRLVPGAPVVHRRSVTGRGLAALAVEWDGRE
ncbi:cytochrome P450 [Nocardia jiangxiensis]|uniref:Cytochrome P450 n=1 Tax=Nocardia jiangxiensis TaxID=282685 RepID=A0ABW6RYM0_9NOCA